MTSTSPTRNGENAGALLARNGPASKNLLLAGTQPLNSPSWKSHEKPERQINRLRISDFGFLLGFGLRISDFFTF
jgi:hypothetical protein